MNIEDKVIIALDTPDKTILNQIINELTGHATYVKVGMELYYTFGNAIVKELKSKNFKVFLDLKLHDIPNTVYKSIKTLSSLEIDMINVHAAGGIEMMTAAKKALTESSVNTMLIAVTQLTSTNQKVMNEELNIQGSIEKTIIQYCKNTQKANLDGVVCSSLEVPSIKKELGSKFICVTPGIRLASDDHHDQKRVMTPQMATKNGADYLVVGRSITQSQSIQETFKNIIKEIS